MSLIGLHIGERPALAAITALVAFTPLPALADPATHTMVLSAEDRSHAGLLSCLIQAKITNVGDTSSPAFVTRFGFLGHPGVEPGTVTYVRFGWPALEPKASDTASDHIEGMRCATVDVTTVMGEATGESTGFIKVDVAPLGAPQVKKQAIFVD